MNNLIKKLVVVSRPAGQSLVTRFNRTAPNLLTASASTNESGRFRDSQAETRTSKHDAMLKRDLANLLKNSRQFESNLNGISHTQKVIRNELQKQQMKISVFELKQLLYMSKTDEDLDLLAQAMNRYLVEYHQPYSSKDSQDLTRTFIELLYMLKKTSKAIELFTNPEMRRLFANHRTTEVLYKLVAEADRFNDFVTVLRKMLPRYYKKVYANNTTTDADNQAQQSSQSSSSSPETSGDGGVVRQKRSGDPLVVPVSHMDIISKYLLKHNSVESLAVLKDLIWRIEKSGEEVQPFFKLRCIVLALQQNEALIAKEFMKNKFLDKDITMQANLKAMIFSKIGREDDCLRVLKNIFLYGNKIFPFTLKMLREDIEAREGASEFKNEIDFYYKRAHLDERIIEGEDLLELLNAPPMLNTEIFVAVANEDDELLANFATLTAHNDDESAQVPLNILDRNSNNSNNKAAAVKIKNNFSSSA